MPRKILVHSRFERAYSYLKEWDKERVDKAIEQLVHYLDVSQSPFGLGVKHLEGDLYEFRVGLSIRIVYILQKNSILLSLIGTHDEVRKFLKRQ